MIAQSEGTRIDEQRSVTAQPSPLRRLRSGPQSLPIDPEMFGTKAPRTSRDGQHPTFQTVPTATALFFLPPQIPPTVCSVGHTCHADAPLTPVNGESAICPPSGVKRTWSKRWMLPVDAPRDKETPGHRVRGFQEVSQPSRDQGALDAPMLLQPCKTQNCYLAMAATRPDPPRGNTMATCGRIAIGAG